MNSFLVTLPTPEPIQLTSTGNYFFKTFTAWGIKRFNSAGIPVPNTGTIYMGVNSGQLPMQIVTGSYISWTVQPNQDDSLSNFWFRGGSGDGLYIISY